MMGTLCVRPKPASPPASGRAAPAAGGPLRVCSFGLTDPGRVRPNNQDHFLIAELAKSLWVLHSSVPQAGLLQGDEEGHLLAVADGVGGHQGGERASSLTILTLEKFLLNTLRWFTALRGPDGEALAQAFQDAIAEAQKALFAEGARRPGSRGMGTTLTLAYAFGRELFVAHVGDSRCYLLRDGALTRLTQDHTLVQELVRHGIVSPEEAAHHPYRHVITNCVGGTEADLRIDTQRLELEPDDLLLLCSDGLTDMVPDERIREVLLAEPDLPQACARLVAEANERGGRDNITAVLARFESAVQS
jgi:protein phosphatase